MPTPFALVLLTVLVVAAVVGLVLWARQTSRREIGPPSARGRGPEAPFDEHSAAAQQARHTGGGLGGSGG